MITEFKKATVVPYLQEIDEVDPRWFLGCQVWLRAAAADTGGSLGLIEQVVPPGFGSPYHVHHNEDEAFYILEGEVEFEVDGTTVVATPGTFAFVARGAAHLFRVLTPTARMLVICSGKPSDNLEHFFLNMGQPATTRTLPVPSAPDEERLVALAAQTGIELV